MNIDSIDKALQLLASKAGNKSRWYLTVTTLLNGHEPVCVPTAGSDIVSRVVDRTKALECLSTKEI